jgi:hypothetical protein
MTWRGVFGPLLFLLTLVLIVLLTVATIPCNTAFGEGVTKLCRPSSAATTSGGGNGWDASRGGRLHQDKDQSFAVEGRPFAQAPTFTLEVTPSSLDVCAPNDATYNVEVGSVMGYSGNVTLSAGGNPAGTTVGFSVNPVTPPGSSTMTIGNTGAAAAGSYSIDVTGTATAGTKNGVVELRLFDAAAAAPEIFTPVDGSIGVSLRPSFAWAGVAQATSYLLEVATDAGFINTVYSAGVSDTGHTLLTSLSAVTSYYWRVTAQNVCGSGTSSTFSFTTRAGTRTPIVGKQIDIWTDGVTNTGTAVAYNSNHDEYLVVWTIWQDSYTHDIWARRVGGDGSLVGPGRFNVATGSGELREDPAVAYNPVQDEYLVVYTKWYTGTTFTSDILAKRVSWNGGWISSEIPISQAVDEQVTPAVTYNSTDDEYLVVYTNQWIGGPYDIYARRVRGSDGVLLTSSAVASGSGTDRVLPSVAYSTAAYGGNGGYLITYVCEDTTTHAKEIRGKVAQGDLADLWPNPEITLCPSGNDQWYPAVASGQEEYLAVWWESAPGGYEVRGRRVGNDGTPQGSAGGFGLSPVYILPGDTPPALAHGDLHDYLGTWRWSIPGPSAYQLHGRYVMDGQDSSSGNPFVIDQGPVVNYPSVACAASGGCLVSYEWWNVSSWDIGARLVWPHGLCLPLALRNS